MERGANMKLNWLLVFIPVAAVMAWLRVNPILVFVASGLAIMPLAELMGDATEALAKYLGQTWGSLLNATLNNAPEIIIGLFALKQGLIEMVKASLTGSIVGNLLFGLGVAMLAGGLKKRDQSYDKSVAGMNGTLMMLAAMALIVPAVFRRSSGPASHELSVEISVVLLLVYVASLVFTFVTSRPILGKEAVEAEGGSVVEPSEEAVGWSRNKALGILLAVTVGLAVMSELLTDAIEPATKSLGLTPAFSGVFLLALVSNVPQVFNAVRFSRKDQMDLALGITAGSSIQVALVVAPVLVFAGMLLGQGMDLQFTTFEVIAIVLAVMVARSVTIDGRSNWFEGLMLVAVYVILGMGFYYLPASGAGTL